MAATAPQNYDRGPDGYEDGQARNGLSPRSYQLEMLEESMQRNIIVAMDTGSGKTLIAILRIQAELERCPVDKLVWFCTPTVALAEQQFKCISEQLPAYQARVLSGKDDCELWNRQTWEQVLKGTRIVVSTYSILLDALVHAFVQVDKLALLVFDEAHRATKDHPANKIMQNFYHHAPATSRPWILGLSASPVINDQVQSLQTLEANLNAIARSPKLHRSDLIKFVHKPELIQLTYDRHDMNDDNVSMMPDNTSLERLSREYENYDLEMDPWIVDMKSKNDSYSERIATKAFMKQETWCRKQLKSLNIKAKRVATELGSWATNAYIHQCIGKFRNVKSDLYTIEQTVEDYEKRYLQQILDKIDPVAAVPYDATLQQSLITPKVRALVEFLAKQDTSSFAGLIFVETRAEVAILSQLLMLHPFTNSFAVSTFVGESSSSNRKFLLGELADVRNQKTTLDDLRHGLKNLVVTTNALEEGIDVSACNLVVCFQKPPNLKSFVQRRGRARKDLSKYVIMLHVMEGTVAMSQWRDLEALMKQMYEDDMRELERLEELEAKEPYGAAEFRVESTGAKLTFAEAVSHLYHFCNKLTPDPYVDQAPIFFYEHHWVEKDVKIFSAKVILPVSVDESVREAHSKGRWTTEKNARRDAAFEAYVALYHGGLVDDHLLPHEAVDQDDIALFAAIEKRPNFAEADQQIDMWPQVAEQWLDVRALQHTTVTVSCAGRQWIDISMLLPIALPDIPEFVLHWDAHHTLEMIIGRSSSLPKLPNIEAAKEATHLILHSVFGNRMNPNRHDFMALFIPLLASGTTSGLDRWLRSHKGTTKIGHLHPDSLSDGHHTFDITQMISSNYGLIRDLTQYEASYIFLHSRQATLDDFLDEDAENLGQMIDEPELVLAVKKFPKRLDFLHAIDGQITKEQGLGIRSVRARSCEMENLPWRMALFAALVPSLLHIIHKTMLVDHLCTGFLAPLMIQDRRLVATAISAPSAQEPTNYQRLEFLGDSVLKLFTSMAMMAQHLIYDEGRLTRAKDHIVSNKSLSSAAIQAGLSTYILLQAFTGRKWRPLYVSDFQAVKGPRGKREMSTKTLADVVESLIGAAYLDGDGGAAKVLDCLKIFLPRIDWTYAANAHMILNDLYQKRVTVIPPLIDQVEDLLNYQFQCKTLLLEAITHASYRGVNKSDSYQRFEFLGDSILDNIVTTRAFHNDPPAPVHRLHLIRTALVNGHFLGYLCMRLSKPISRTETRVLGQGSVETYHSETLFILWQAMRHHNAAIVSDQKACLARYEDVQDELISTLNEGTHYPWTLLARLEPPKFFSDIIESIIAAIWIDSHGSMAACSAFLDRLGLIPYLEKVLSNDNLALLHPKEELGQLADQDKVTYTIAVDEDNETGKKRLTCNVMLGEREIVNVGDGLTRMEVETRAADEACKILRTEGRTLGKGRNDTAHEVEDEKEEEEDVRDEQVEEDDGVAIEHMESRKRKINEVPIEEEDNDDDDRSDEEQYMSAED